jgi:peptide chain release factor subunit 1
MAVQSPEVLEIVDFAPEGFLVTSFYLDVDAAQLPSPDQLASSFDSLIHEAENRRKQIEHGLSHDSVESIRRDLAHIRTFFGEGFDRHDTKGMAMFSCSAQGFWRTYHLPTPVKSSVFFEPKPRVAPIAKFLSRTKPTAILVLDKRHARLITMARDEVREWTNIEDFVPQPSDPGGWSQMRYERRSDHWRKQHVDHAAELTLRLLRHYPFDWLILGNEVQTEADLEKDLHPYLRDRVIGHIRVRIDANLAEIVEKARELRDRVESTRIDRLMDQIKEFAGAGGRGTIGLASTVDALNQQRIHILLVQEGFQQPGAVCHSCGMIVAEPRARCPGCDGAAQQVDGVVDSVIQRALELGSTVEVATGQDQLVPIQSIGAVLYY